MAIIPLPAKFGFSKVNSFKLQRASNILRSKFTGQGQRVIYPYAVWELDANLVEYDGVDAGRLRSFLVQLEGQKNTFRLPVPGYTRPLSGYAGGAAVQVAASARASSLTLNGLTGVNAPFLREGDFFTVNDELKMVIGDYSTGAGSSATINFRPALRKPVAANSAVLIQNPTVLMTAAEDDIADWSIAPPIRQLSKFLAIEALDV